MSQAILSQILNQLDTLAREELEQLIQAIRQHLSQQEKKHVTDLIPANQDCSVWSPYDAFEAAEIMLKVLQDSKAHEKPFQHRAYQSSLDAIWDNEEDDIYAHLLETGEQTNG